jgi:hypothetical protein
MEKKAPADEFFVDEDEVRWGKDSCLFTPLIYLFTLPLPSASMFLRLIAPTNQPEEGLRACRNLQAEQIQRWCLTTLVTCSYE